MHAQASTRSALVSYGAHLILYRIVQDDVEIVRVVLAARNLDDLIEKSQEAAQSTKAERRAPSRRDT